MLDCFTAPLPQSSVEIPLNGRIGWEVMWQGTATVIPSRRCTAQPQQPAEVPFFWDGHIALGVTLAVPETPIPDRVDRLHRPDHRDDTDDG